MPGIARKITAAAIAASLIAVPTGAIAGSAAPVAAPVATAAPANPWVALSAMTSSSSTAAAAAQGEEGMGFPPILPLIVIVGTVILGIWIITRDDDDDDGLGLPVSPT